MLMMGTYMDKYQSPFYFIIFLTNHFNEEITTNSVKDVASAKVNICMVSIFIIFVDLEEVS